MPVHIPRNIQSPYVAADFWAKWGSVNPRIALFLLITPKSFWTGVSPVGITSNTRDMTLPGHPGVIFKSAPGILPSAFEWALDEPTNVELTAIYRTGIFERADVIASKWNFAEIEIFGACWDNTDLGEFLYGTQNLGEFKDFQQYFTTEGRGKLSRLSNNVNKVTQRLCRVKEFRDAECGHSAATVTIDGDVIDIVQTSEISTQVDAENLQIDSATLDADTPLGFFTNGTITAETGANAGVSREIAYSGNIVGPGYIDVWVKRRFPYDFAVGDEVTLTAGCTRTLENCRLYENAVNFRGEPFVPGIESANRIESAN